MNLISPFLGNWLLRRRIICEYLCLAVLETCDRDTCILIILLLSIEMVSYGGYILWGMLICGAIGFAVGFFVGVPTWLFFGLSRILPADTVAGAGVGQGVGSAVVGAVLGAIIGGIAWKCHGRQTLDNNPNHDSK
jgi:hypothetical protein